MKDMTVQEMIDKLKQYDDDLTVHFRDGEGFYTECEFIGLGRYSGDETIGYADRCEYYDDEVVISLY